MTYEDLPPISFSEAESKLKTASPAEAAAILIRLALHQPARDSVEALLLNALNDPRPEVRAAAITSLGHVARLHRNISPASLHALRALRLDPLLAPFAEDALDDVAIFVNTTHPQ